MRETKVNLKHLLEDIRDSYAIAAEEIILLELIANALDSGASRISFYINPSDNILTSVDNGRGMRRNELVGYHNIAATAKIKGRGIGFAGVGAKISLLLGEKVCTETKGGHGSRCATEWHLKNETSAPWKFIPFSGKVLFPRGTAVSILFKNFNSPLLSEEFIKKTIYNHFYPLFHPNLFEPILKHIYKKGVEFYINDKKVFFEVPEKFYSKIFQIRLGGRRSRLAGTGFLTKLPNPSPNNIFSQGLAVSTYGKIIKSGWEWIGISPKEEGHIYGVVEIPALAEILTTNKMDFLKNAGSLKKYYQYRKAIQEAITPILKEFGEGTGPESFQKQYRSLSKEIERTLRNVLKDFPELTPLLGMKKTNKGAGFGEDADAQLVSIIENNKQVLNAEKIQQEQKQEAKKNITADNKKGGRSPYLIIGFEDRTANDSLARMVENRILINNYHPAYLKAKEENLDEYHIIFSVALTLSSFLEDKHQPQEFINDFLNIWGRGAKKTAGLFKIS